MFSNLGLHVIQYPTGRFGYVGSIPRSLGNEIPASSNAVMGGRAYRNARGEIVETKFPSFTTREDAIVYAAERGFEI